MHIIPNSLAPHKWASYPRNSLEYSSIDTVTHASFYSCLYATHQRNRAVLLLVVEEERPVRKPADKVIAPVLLDNPVLSHVGIIPHPASGTDFSLISLQKTHLVQ